MDSTPPRYRLSSRLTIPARILYLATVLVLATGALAGMDEWMRGSLSPGQRVAGTVLILGGAGVLFRLFRFLSVTLDDRNLIIRSFWREWRVPAWEVAEVRASQHDGLGVVRVVLARQVPGLGRTLRFLTPMLATDGQSAAELIDVARRARPRGV